jgi:hypothetical protein
MVELQSLTNILWYDDFIGIGYRYHDIYMNVFPIFEDRSYASKLWDKTIRWWPDDEIRLRFVEQEEDKKNTYWFILYNTAQHMDEHTGFAKKLQISDNYQRFKAGYEKQVILRFGIYKENPKKVKRESDNKKFDLVLLKKHKTVYDIQFMSFSNLSSDSIAMSYIVNDEK